MNGYEVVTELEVVLKSGYYKPFLGYEIVGWFVDEIIKLENEMTFYFKNTRKDIIMTQEVKGSFENNNHCRFCKNEKTDNKVRDHCHLTRKYRGSAHSECNINVKQSQSNFVSVILHDFFKYDCHLFFKSLVDEKKDKIIFKIIPKTNEEQISVTYGCIKYVDSYRLLSSSLDKLVETLVDDSHKSPKNLEKGIVGERNVLNTVN